MIILAILTLLQPIRVPAINITKCCPEFQFLNTKTKQCSNSTVSISSLPRVNILSLINNIVSEDEQSVNYTKIPSNPLNQCNKSLRNNSGVIIRSFFLFDNPTNSMKTVVLNQGKSKTYSQFCLDLSEDNKTPVVHTCLPCTKEKPCLNFCCPPGKVSNVNNTCEKRNLSSHHWQPEKDKHTPVHVIFNCSKTLVYPTFKFTKAGEMEVDKEIRELSEYCISHGESGTDVLVCSEEDGVSLQDVFKITLMTLSLVCFLILISIHVLIEEVRKQHFSKLKIPFYSCLFVSYLSLIITNLHDFTNNVIICVFLALVIQYFSLAIFFWLTCMSLDIWLTFNRMENPLQNPARREERLRCRLRSFFVFAFGSPFVITIVTLTLQLFSNPEEAAYVHPG